MATHRTYVDPAKGGLRCKCICGWQGKAHSTAVSILRPTMERAFSHAEECATEDGELHEEEMA